MRRFVIIYQNTTIFGLDRVFDFKYRVSASKEQPYERISDSCKRGLKTLSYLEAKIIHI